MDVSTAFLHRELTEEVYMRQPEGFIELGKEHQVCHLQRSVYGLTIPTVLESYTRQLTEGDGFHTDT